MGGILKTALILAGCAFIIALVYTKIPIDTLPQTSTTTATYAALTPTVPSGNTIEIGGQVIRVDIADTPEKRARGLSGRKRLAENEGMLFIFTEDGRHGFWMKDMLFPIDIVWISKDGRIVDTLQNAAPESYPEYSFLPNVAARYVVELPAGFADRYNVKIGDNVRL